MTTSGQTSYRINIWKVILLIRCNVNGSVYHTWNISSAHLIYALQSSTSGSGSWGSGFLEAVEKVEKRNSWKQFYTFCRCCATPLTQDQDQDLSELHVSKIMTLRFAMTENVFRTMRRKYYKPQPNGSYTWQPAASFSVCWQHLHFPSIQKFGWYFATKLLCFVSTLDIIRGDVVWIMYNQGFPIICCKCLNVLTLFESSDPSLTAIIVWSENVEVVVVMKNLQRHLN